MSFAYNSDDAEDGTGAHKRGTSSPSALTNRRQVAYWIILVVLVVLTVADNVLVVSLFDLCVRQGSPRSEGERADCHLPVCVCSWVTCHARPQAIHRKLHLVVRAGTARSSRSS
jgi:hypothetical protein